MSTITFDVVYWNNSNNNRKGAAISVAYLPTTGHRTESYWEVKVGIFASL